MRKIMMAAVAIMLMAAATLFTGCTKEEIKVVEYGKVFSYAHEGQTLYYIVDSSGDAAVVPPMFPYFDYEADETWTGYDKPQGPVVIPDYVPYAGSKYPVRRIMYCAFFRCDDITSVKLPSTLISIDKHSFLFCSSLTSVVVPEGVTTISYGAFDSCESMTSVKLPSTLKSLGDWCFYSCIKLSEINLPDGLESIGQNCFTDMPALKSITLPENLKSMGIGVFDSCSGLTEVTIPDGIKALPDWTFSNCTGLTTVHLSDETTSIGYGAFNNTPNLKDFALPAKLKTIDAYAFMYDEKLGPDLVIPEGVTSIGESAFGNCSGIKSITLACTTPPAITESTFPDYSITVFVSRGAGNAYRNHDIWGRFADIREKE
ncbi:MAG: leucine-rich repeat domain-containing protein [Bacteroidaceae bacterium]|nr:leucine-rich repeat domain-containing protein [Bacteroidaceae bacterium]